MYTDSSGKLNDDRAAPAHTDSIEGCSTCGNGKQQDDRQRRLNIIALVLVGLVVLAAIILPLSASKRIDYNEYEQGIPTVAAVGKLSCPACAQQKEVFAEVGAAYGGRVNIVYYDKSSDFARELAKDYDIAFYPTLFFLDASGNVVHTSAPLSATQLQSAINARGW